MLVILILVAIITGVIIDSFSAKYAHAASDTPLRMSSTITGTRRQSHTLENVEM